MRAIPWLISRMILTRFIAILGGITVFVISLTVVTHSEEILRVGGRGARSILEYGLLLAPVTASTFMAISILLAILLTLIELSARNELTAIWATGLSPVRIIVMLLPVALVMGGLTFLIADQGVPRVTPYLHDWGIGEHGSKKSAVREQDPIWLKADRDVLRAKKANRDATILEDIIIFRRDANGRLVEQIEARQASLVNRRWELLDAVVYYAENEPPSRLDKLIYSGNMRPAREGKRSGQPAEMSTVDLGYFIKNEGFGVRPVHVFETWWHRRISLLLTPWLMIAICIPLAVRFRRGGGGGRLFMTGLAIGFTFSIFEGISLTMGEVGFVPSWFGAWAPFLTFSAVAGAFAFRAETVA